MRTLTLLALSAGIAACSPGAPGDDPARNQISAMPTAEPSTAVPTPVDANILTANGWGPLRIGMTRADVVTAVGGDSRPDAVGGNDPQACDIFHPERAPTDMQVMIEDGRLTRIALTGDAAVVTERGFAIGSSASDIKTAFGADADVEGHKYEPAPAEYITVWQGGSNGGVYTDNPEARGIRYVVGASGLVSAIYAGGPSIQYVEGCS